MTTRRWDDDEHLLEDLADALRGVAPIARRLAEHAAQAYSWRTVDDDLLLAALSFDSSLGRQPQTRSEPLDARVLIFNAAPLSVELEVSAGQIAGQLIPPCTGEIVVETVDGGRRQIATDESGFFLVSPLPKGQVRFRCETPEARLVTDWVTL